MCHRLQNIFSSEIFLIDQVCYQLVESLSAKTKNRIDKKYFWLLINLMHANLHQTQKNKNVFRLPFQLIFAKAISKRQVLFLNIRFSLSLLACSQLIYQGSVQNVCFGNITNYYWSAPYKSLRFQIITSYFSTDSKSKFQLILFYYCRQTKITLTFCSLLVSCVTNSI